jgi:hypothetical protein
MYAVAAAAMLASMLEAQGVRLGVVLLLLALSVIWDEH